MAELTFSIGEVAAMLDISRHTLRAWERRHQMVEPVRTPSGQRRYTGEDVEILRQAKHERRVHGVSMRVAAMTAQGLIVPEALERRPAAGEPPNDAATEDPLRGVLNVLPELVIVLDSQGTVTDANTAFVRFCDILPGRLRGMQFADFVDPFDRAKAVRTYQPSLQRRRDWELNLRGSRRRALFSFDCWPIRWPHETRLVLVGRETGGASTPAQEPDPSGGAAEASQRPVRACLLPPRLREVLAGTADPVRTLRLLRAWLDATRDWVALVQADADLTVVSVNAALRDGRRAPAPEGLALREVWPDAASALSAGAADQAIGTGRMVTLRGEGPEAPTPRPDLELHPITGPAGTVTNLLIAAADIAAETEVSRRLDPLIACGVLFDAEVSPMSLLRRASQYVPSLVPNAGSLVATSLEDGGRGLAVVGAWGACSLATPEAARDFRLALVQDAVRVATALEVRWEPGPARLETLRVVPLPAAEGSGQQPEALGALAFVRLGAASFSAQDRDLIDEFAARLGTALARARTP